MRIYLKQKRLFAFLEDYLKSAEKCLEKFLEGLNYALENGIDRRFELIAGEIDEQEQLCEDLRRKLEAHMFSESLLPETREDMLAVIEMMAEIPRHCEDVADTMLDQNSVIMPVIKKELSELADISIKAFRNTVKGVHETFGPLKELQKLTHHIDDYSNLGAFLERKMTKKVFSKEEILKHPGYQLIQKEIIDNIWEICNLCKHIAEKLTIISIKRRF